MTLSVEVVSVERFQIGVNKNVNGSIHASSPLFYYVDINSENDPKKKGILEVSSTKWILQKWKV